MSFLFPKAGADGCCLTNFRVGFDVFFAWLVAIVLFLEKSFPCFDLYSQVFRLRFVVLPGNVVHDCFFYIMPVRVKWFEHAFWGSATQDVGDLGVEWDN